MRLLDAAHSAPARYALVFAGLSAVVMGALLALIYGWATSLLERHLEEVVEQQLSVLRADLVQDGRDSVVGLVRQHAKRQDASPMHLLVQDGKGRVLAGDLPPVTPSEGWQEIKLPPDSGDLNGARRMFRGLGTRLDDNTFILVMHDTADLRQTRALLIWSFAIALGITTALALFGGLAIGGALLRRVDDINRTARAIMDGDLSRRIPAVGWHDELGRLAESLNQMFARIEALMENLRHITSSISHDLRSPLGRHRQRLEATRLKPRSPAEYETAIDAAVEDTCVILEIFDAILRIAQIEAGTPRERFSQVDLSGVAENIMDAFVAVAEDEGKPFLARIDPNITARGDRELLTQMLVNLVENALRHTPNGTRLQMCIEMRAGRPQITLSDNGPGIPAKERDRVFRRFYRLDASRTTPGSGLGLSFVAAVAKLHDATISLEDNSPGLRVVVAFPQAMCS